MASPATATRGDTDAAIGPDRAFRRQVVLVRIGDWIGGLPIDRVDRVLPAVAIHASGRGGGDLLGHINVHGAIVPVADARAILGIRRRPIGLADHLVLVSVSDSPVIVPVDEALGVGVVLDATIEGDADVVPQALRPVKIERLESPVVTLIDPDRVFGHVASAGLASAQP